MPQRGGAGRTALPRCKELHCLFQAVPHRTNRGPRSRGTRAQLLDRGILHGQNALRCAAHYAAEIAAITNYGGAVPAAELDSSAISYTRNMATRAEIRDAMKTVCWGILWIVGACWFWYSCVGNPFDELALIRRAHTTPGFIIDAWEDVEDGARGEAHWFHAATYKYRLPDGREFTQRTRDYSGRLKDEFHDLTQPHPIEVEYLPENPAVSRIKGEGSDGLIDWLWRKVGLGLVLLALFLSPGLVLLRNGCREILRLRAVKN